MITSTRHATMSSNPSGNIYDIAEEIKSKTVNLADLNKIVLAQREAILIAFMAEFRCKPSEIVQAFQHTPTGFNWQLRRAEPAQQPPEGRGQAVETKPIDDLIGRGFPAQQPPGQEPEEEPTDDDGPGLPVRCCAPNGLPIRGTLERVHGVCDGSFWVKPGRRPVFEQGGRADIWWDGQESLVRCSQLVFVDTEGNEWLERELVFPDIDPR